MGGDRPLYDDRASPATQRHTAKRIFDRLRDEGTPPAPAKLARARIDPKAVEISALVADGETAEVS